MTQPVDEFERDLQQALRHKQPSVGFTARVLCKLPEERPSGWLVRFHHPVLRWAAVAVVVIGASSGGYMYREHQQELERGRVARQQLMLALRITGAKLQLAQQKVQQIGADHNTASQETEKDQ